MSKNFKKPPIPLHNMHFGEQIQQDEYYSTPDINSSNGASQFRVPLTSQHGEQIQQDEYYSTPDIYSSNGVPQFKVPGTPRPGEQLQQDEHYSTPDINSSNGASRFKGSATPFTGVSAVPLPRVPTTPFVSATEKPSFAPRLLIPDHIIRTFQEAPTNPLPAVLPPESPGGVQRLLSLLPRRILGFSVVGGSVMIGGILLLFVLVHFLYVEEHLAYLIMAITSIETNFFLNRFLNWKGRDGHLAAQWLKFHSTSAITFPLNQALFALLTWIGVHYLLVTVIGAGMAAIINYIANDRFVFHLQDVTKKETVHIPAIQSKVLYPHVGVVIPVRNSHRTIRGCLYSLFKQEYKGKISIFLVGNTPDQDTTWDMLKNMVNYPGLHCIQIKRPTGWVGRDANIKRYCGCEAALRAGVDVIALLDSQVEAAPDWLSNAIGLLSQYHIDAVAGESCRATYDIHLSSIYQDGSLVSEWPRFGTSFFLSRKTFQQTKGLPVTNNLLITRRVWEDIHRKWPLQAAYSWEDFRLAWEMVQAGFTICCTNTVQVQRYHKPKFRLIKHIAAGAGAVTFYLEHPDCSYVQRMLLKAGMVVSSLLVMLAVLITGISLSNTLILEALAGCLGCGYLVLALLSIVRARDIRGLLFPALDLVHILFWIAGAGSVVFREEPSGGKHLAEMLVTYR